MVLWSAWPAGDMLTVIVDLSVMIGVNLVQNLLDVIVSDTKHLHKCLKCRLIQA